MSASNDATAELAEWATGFGYADAPAELLRAAGRGLIDTIGVILAGAPEETALRAGLVARSQGGKPESSVLGTDLRTSASLAALVNGTAAHALDYDDTQGNVHGHPSAVIVPAALAVAESVQATGKQLVEAFVVGTEVMGKAGRMLGSVPYQKGWHLTSVLGPLGAAAAAGKLLGLSIEQFRVALGIAVSQASGSRQNFGTMTKPFHIGWSAHGGVLAAMLAANGYTANEDMLTAPLGLTTLFDGDAERWSSARPGEPFELVDPGLNMKVYPCCAGTHCALDATFECREQLSETDLAAIEQIDVNVHATGLVPLIYDYPATGLQGKFCLRYVMSAALQDGQITVETFDDDRVRDGVYAGLMDRVKVFQDPTIEERFAEVIVHIPGREPVRSRVQEVKGSATKPMTDDDLDKKFLACSQRVISSGSAKEALVRLRAVEQIRTVSDLAALFVL